MNTDLSREPRHGQDGWTLLEYDWHEKTGVGEFLYRHEDGRIAKIGRLQPTLPGHEGWLASQFPS